ncbi:hypothetical protein U8V72_23220 [Priestia filamentosa]|uniref:hypothetical protein n=1 Tax=Priestia filamentosa TaxID=1402861 RepID=UPI00058910C3
MPQKTWNTLLLATALLASTCNINGHLGSSVEPLVVYAESYPTATLTASTTSITSSPVTITAQGTDENGMKRIKTPDGAYVSGGTTSYVVNKNGTYYFNFENTLGKVTTQSIKINNIDNYPPFIWSANLEPETRTNGSVTIFISAGDDTGVRKIVLPDGSSVTHPNASYTVSQNGTYTFQVEDKMGRTISHPVTISNIDKEVPTVRSISIHKDLTNTYSLDVKTEDSNGISKVVTNTGQTLTEDLNDSGHFFLKGIQSSSKPTSVQITDALDNVSSNEAFLDVPTIYERPRASLEEDAVLEVNGSGTLTYKRDYKTYTCSTKPCIITVDSASFITAYNQSGNKYASSEYKVAHMNKTNTNFTLSGKRNKTNANVIDFSWNQTINSGTLNCETPDGMKTHNVSGTSYSLNGKNYEYKCSLEATIDGVITQSNWLTFSPDYTQSVISSQPSDSIPDKTLSKDVNIFIEKDGTGETYFINTRLKNTNVHSVPVPMSLQQ